MGKDVPTIEVSEDCISREFALEVISDYVNYPTEGDKACAIKNAPSVVPSRAEGEWIVSEDGDSTCSVCGASEEEFIYGTENWYGMGDSNYCPACGTKTKGESK